MEDRFSPNFNDRIIQVIHSADALAMAEEDETEWDSMKPAAIEYATHAMMGDAR